MASGPHVTEEYIAEFKEAFSVFSKEAKEPSAMTLGELQTIVKQLELTIPDPELQNWIKPVDADGQGSIDFPAFLDFLEGYMKKSYPKEPKIELKDAFNVFDANNKGTISAKELRQVLTTLGETLKEDEIADFMQLAGGAEQIDYASLTSKLQQAL
eukprot:gb/GEZN01011313.1/.p1 GENE.gb/GEZN01011313.1/~~gb/GEZN01011313.1/.p1  ORF type:complete len:167 (+),score=36.76 gb/GEZN01011313.1/:36-503(+)